MIRFKGAHFPQEIILMCVRWYLAYPLSYRQVEELIAERGVPVDHATIHRWVLKYSPPEVWQRFAGKWAPCDTGQKPCAREAQPLLIFKGVLTSLTVALQ